MIKIYDSFSQTLKPLINHEKTVQLYLCGPTVYHYIHIGNARPVLVMDVLHRLLIHQKYQINYVHNITDIDDKIINQAIAQKTSPNVISEKYTLAYLADLKTLNIISPTMMPKVSDYLPPIINFINSLINASYAYISDDDVYFNVSKIPDYGSLSHKKITDLIPNLELQKGAFKNNPLDFALWKKTKIGINWNSPWGQGRPGWHTECVTFVHELFNGQTIDLHGGGIDLKFPHHENERAQFYAHHQTELAHIWWHNGHVNLANEKMSKSLNNTVLVKDFCQKFHPNVLRFLMLNRNHQQPITFNSLTLDYAIITIKRYENILKQWTYQLFINNSQQVGNYDQLYYQAIINHLSNNLDTTNTITVIETMIKQIKTAIVKQDFSQNQKDVFATLVFGFEILGFNFQFGNYTSNIKLKIKKWEQLKNQKNYQAADQIRAELQDLNII